MTVTFLKFEGNEPSLRRAASEELSARRVPVRIAIEPGAIEFVGGVFEGSAPLKKRRPVSNCARGSNCARKISESFAKSGGTSASTSERAKLKTTSVPASSSEETTSAVAPAGAFVIRVTCVVGMSAPSLSTWPVSHSSWQSEPAINLSKREEPLRVNNKLLGRKYKSHDLRGRKFLTKYLF